jgi:4-hydroxybutyryl-CoA dehydratase/vinylacetyl-CoA-Delta-isomerase
MTQLPAAEVSRAFELPGRHTPIKDGNDYIASLRGRDLRVYYLGERVREPVDHPVIRPSVNAGARTYDLAVEQPDSAVCRHGRPERAVLDDI